MVGVIELRKYPVTGMQGEKVDSLTFTKEAIVGNTLFTVIQEKDLERYLQDPGNPELVPVKVPQTLMPQLALLTAAYENERLVLSDGRKKLFTDLFDRAYPTFKPLVNQSAQDAELQWALSKYMFPIKVNRKATTHRLATDCGNAVAEWLSQRLNRKVRLFQAVKNSESPKQHFAWYTDFHLITLASLIALSKEVGEHVDVRTLRPNIIVDRTRAYEELVWDTVILGGVQSAVDACKRCGYLGNDNDTGHGGAHQRVVHRVSNEHDLIFGVYLQPSEEVTIQLGDQLKVQY